MTAEELVAYWTTQRLITDRRIVAAFLKVPREKFVPVAYRKEAYDDRALPLGEGQTISQPTTVMLMLQALQVKGGEHTLEVGTGSGWNAALLSVLTGKKGKVYSVDVNTRLASAARHRLKMFTNVKVLCRDGSEGLKTFAPFDRIIVTAACPALPPPLLAQLRDGGVIVAPVGTMHHQEVVVGVKKKELETRSLGHFVFVPLLGRYGFMRSCSPQ